MILEYGLEKDALTYNKRLSCRAIICQNNKVLMVKTNKGDCMFPGGGRNKGESSKEAVKREVLEETGYTCSQVGEKFCTAYERRADRFKPNEYFEMVNEFFICKVGSTVKKQCLEQYEKDCEFQAIWMDIDEAIDMNKIYRKQLKNNDFWRLKTIHILEMLKTDVIPIQYRY